MLIQSAPAVVAGSVTWIPPVASSILAEALMPDSSSKGSAWL